MNHRACLCKVLTGEATPWVPNYELGCWNQTVGRWRAEGLPEKDSWIGRLDMFEGEPYFNLDRRAFARLDGNLFPVFDYEIISETGQYLTARHWNGIVTMALKEGTVGGQRMSMDAYLGYPVTDRKSWEDMRRRYDPAIVWRYPFNWGDQVKAWQDRDYPVVLMSNGTFGLYSQLRSWCGTEGISYLFYDEPALVEEMLEVATTFFLALVERALNSGVQFEYFNYFEDCAGKGGPLFGPELFNRFFRRHYRRINDRLHQAGIRSIWVDCDGDMEALIPCWMDCGINLLWPLEQASGMDPVRLRKKFGKSLCLAGGIDKREIAKGPKFIEKELRAKIPPLLEQGGYIPHIDHAIPPDISLADMNYYMDLKLKMIGHPQGLNRKPA